MKALIVDNVQEDAKARRLLREALRRHFPAAGLDYVIHEVRAGDPIADVVRGRLGDQLYPRGPPIRIDDGSLGVWILSLRTPADYVRYIFGVIAGRYGHPLAKFIPAARIVCIRSGAPLPVQADGDLIGTTPIEVTVLPGALTVWTPVPRAE